MQPEDAIDISAPDARAALCQAVQERIEARFANIGEPYVGAALSWDCPDGRHTHLSRTLTIQAAGTWSDVAGVLDRLIHPRGMLVWRTFPEIAEGKIVLRYFNVPEMAE